MRLEHHLVGGYVRYISPHIIIIIINIKLQQQSLLYFDTSIAQARETLHGAGCPNSNSWVVVWLYGVGFRWNSGRYWAKIARGLGIFPFLKWTLCVQPIEHA